jgi:hypothetical protein
MAAPRRIAIVTFAQEPQLYAEEKGIVALLRARGIEADAVVWNDPHVNWSRYPHVLLRSTWDYFQHYDDFLAWLGRVEKTANVWNPPSLVRWNLDKMYLRDLERRGVRIVPTEFCEAGTDADLAGIVGSRSWTRAVVKPAVSGGAYRTHLFDATEVARYQPELTAILRSSGALVQPFFPEVEAEGEWSFLFFGGTLSHVVLKVPSKGEYRVQELFGGTFKEADPGPAVLAQAQAVLNALPEAPAYARIDGIRRGADFYLMEAELVEPYLYLSAKQGSLESFVDVIVGSRSSTTGQHPCTGSAVAATMRDEVDSFPRNAQPHPGTKP